MAIFCKFSVIGGVVIPNYLRPIVALSGASVYSFYSYSRDMNKTYGVKLSERLTRFMTGSVTLMAGSIAYDLYATNKDLARIRDMDKTDFVKMMTARRFPIYSKTSVPGSMIAGAGAIGMMILTLIELSSFHKKTVMEYNSANPYSV